MRITCQGYAYDCSYDVKIGDKVLVSVSSTFADIFGRTREVKVTALSSDYDGYCESVLKVLEE
jgi:hypothetical protein